MKAFSSQEKGALISLTRVVGFGNSSFLPSPVVWRRVSLSAAQWVAGQCWRKSGAWSPRDPLFQVPPPDDPTGLLVLKKDPGGPRPGKLLAPLPLPL